MGGVEFLISIGKIVRPHGIRGEVKVSPLTDWLEIFQTFRSMYLESEGDHGEWIKVEKTRIHGNRVVVKLSGIDDRNRAESICGFVLKVHEKDCPPLPEGYFRIDKLIGLKVSTMEGEDVGIISDVLRMPAQDVYVVDANGREILIPAVKDFIKHVDIEKKIMLIEPIEGLLE